MVPETPGPPAGEAAGELQPGGPVRLERRGAVAVLTLDRPERLNALNLATLDGIAAACRVLAADDGVRAVVVTGAGEKAFCAGADLKERSAMSPEEVRAYSRKIRATFTALAELPQPVVAAVHGIALGGGTELALACDLRVADETAVFGQTEVRLGIIPGAGGTQRLPRIVGVARAKELIFTGRRVPAAEALAIGLVHEVVPAGRALPRALEVADAIAANAPLAVRAAKRAIDGGLDRPIADGLRAEGEAYETTLYTEDRLEGLRAFAEKRPPRFVGR